MMRRIVAWRCRRMLRDLAVANDRQDEIAKQAVAAVNALPSDPEALLLLARYAATVGDLQHALVYYRAGLEISPLWYSAWPEYAAVLEACGHHEQAQEFVDARNAVIDAIPALTSIRPALLAAIRSYNGDKTRE